jgi:hypothetical protein
MILGFKEQFAAAVKDGSKPHSFRKGRRWRRGMGIQFYIKVRQSGMCKFMPDGICKEVQDAHFILRPDRLDIFIDRKWLKGTTIDNLITKDGFSSLEDFIAFFFPDGKPGEWEGQLVHWTDLRY